MFTRGLKFFWAFVRRLYHHGTSKKSKLESEPFDLNDEFNLPISLAFGILIFYILFGVFIYSWVEPWSVFEAFYFVFTSLTTIGLGDFVPEHPIFMMCSVLYLIFGLAVTSMVINVVQIKMSRNFIAASSKIGSTIGLNMTKEGIEVPASHGKSSLNDISETGNAENGITLPPIPQRTENVPESSSPKEVRRKKKVVVKK